MRALLATYEAQEGSGRKSWDEARRRIQHVFAGHLDRPIVSLTPADLQMTADAHPARQSASAAVRYLRPVLKWGAKREFVARDVALIEPPAAVKRRDRVLSRDELKRLLPALPCIGQSLPHVFHRSLHKMAASFAIEAVASAPHAGQVKAIARKTIARLSSWMFPPI